MALSSNLVLISSHLETNDNRNKEILRISNQTQISFSNSLRPVNHGKYNVTKENNSLVISTSSERYNKYPALYPCSKGDIRSEHEKLLNLFKHMLSTIGVQDPSEALAMIDAVQRVGIDHYFLDEIEKILEGQFNMFPKSCYDQDLHEVALRFRLLRQQGHHVSADVFNNFIDDKKKFSKNVGEDIKGLMSLYEASQLSIHGEDILDEANKLCVHALHKLTTHIDDHQARMAKMALEHPYHKSLAITSMTENFGGEGAGWVNVVQEFTKLDRNIIRSLHQDEMIQIFKWWKEVGLANELKFARDQPLKWFIWSTTCFKDSSLSSQRLSLTKAISFIYLIDDIFDVYGTLDELILFTQAVNRWDDHTAIDRLPHYLKICFKALDDVTKEISTDIYKEYGKDPTNFLRKTWARLCNAFLAEAKWFASGHIPNSEEYLKNGIVSSGVPVALVHAFFLLGNYNDTTINCIDDDPTIISSTATILRLWDDLGTSKDEDQDGYDGSYAKYYIRENIGTSMEDARSRVTHMIGDAWKQLNKECLYPNNQFSKTFLKASLNTARMVPLMYTYDENHCLPSLDKYINTNIF